MSVESSTEKETNENQQKEISANNVIDKAHTQ